MNSENLQLKEERDRHVRELSDMSEVGKRRDQELIRIEEIETKRREKLIMVENMKDQKLTKSGDAESKEKEEQQTTRQKHDIFKQPEQI